MKFYDNEEGVFNAVMGDYNGGVHLFTHRDPKSGMIWGEDIPVKGNKAGSTELGAWVAPESVNLKYGELPSWNEMVI